jgi:hypothetical protein
MALADYMSCCQVANFYVMVLVPGMAEKEQR